MGAKLLKFVAFLLEKHGFSPKIELLWRKDHDTYANLQSQSHAVSCSQWLRVFIGPDALVVLGCPQALVVFPSPEVVVLYSGIETASLSPVNCVYQMRSKKNCLKNGSCLKLHRQQLIPSYCIFLNLRSKYFLRFVYDIWVLSYNGVWVQFWLIVFN